MLLKRLPLILLIAAMAAAGYLALAAFADMEGVARATAAIGTGAIVLVFALSLVNYALRYLRWRYLLGALGHTIPEGANLSCYLAGFAFTATPGKAGEAVRTLYLLRYGVSASESIGALIFDRLFDLVAMILLAALLFLHWGATLALAVAVCLGCAFAGVPAVRRVFVAVLQRLSSLVPARARSKLGALSNLKLVTARLAQPKLLAIGFALSFPAWLAEGYGLHVLAAALGQNLDVTAAIGVYAVSILIGVVSFLPGGLGSTEAAMGLLLSRHGLSPESAVAATILCRIATLWFAVVLGVIAALWLAIRRQPAANIPAA